MRRFDMQVRMTGRWAVWPTMSALFFSMLIDSWLPETLLYIGLALTLAATALYLVDGARALRSRAVRN